MHLTITCTAFSQGQLCRWGHTTHSPRLGRIPCVGLKLCCCGLEILNHLVFEPVFCERSQMGRWCVCWGLSDTARTGFHLLEMCPQTLLSNPGALSPAQTLPSHPHLMATATLHPGWWPDLSGREKTGLHHHPLSTAGASMRAQVRVGLGQCLVASWGRAGWGVSCPGLVSPSCIQQATWQQPLAHPWPRYLTCSCCN